MSRVKVKICGIRSLEEAEAALEAGADALGFNFWKPSPRYVEPETAREIIARLPRMAATIGVFVNEERDRVLELASELRLSAVQLHGDETPEFCEELSSIKTIKAIRVGRDFDLNQIGQYAVGMILLDSKVSGNYGGTGRRFDWRIAIEAKQLAPIILAGGLTTETVWDAVTHVRPAAIDVCSGVEAEPGRKDFARLQHFMSVVTRANALITSEAGAAAGQVGFL